jgi:hypothetical protein
MEKIPTAEEFLKEAQSNPSKGWTARKLMIEFAKLHVEAALKKASEKSYVEYIDLETKEVFDYTDVITDDGVGADVNKDSILNSYSLDKIK